MNTEAIIEIAKIYKVDGVYRDYYRLDEDDIKAFAQAIEAQVREECAAICEAHGNERLIIRPMSINDDPWKVGVFDCVELLRGDYKL